MTSRNSIPIVNETAKHARARGCLVADSIGDGHYVVRVEDFYPQQYAWTIHWSNGMRSGVRNHEPKTLGVATPEREPEILIQTGASVGDVQQPSGELSLTPSKSSELRPSSADRYQVALGPSVRTGEGAQSHALDLIAAEARSGLQPGVSAIGCLHSILKIVSEGKQRMNEAKFGDVRCSQCEVLRLGTYPTSSCIGGGEHDWMSCSNLLAEALTRVENLEKVEELFHVACEACNCVDPNCGLVLNSRCHPKAGTHVKFFKGTGVLQIDCAACDKLVAQLEVANPHAVLDS